MTNLTIQTEESFKEKIQEIEKPSIIVNDTSIHERYYKRIGVIELT